jgi:cell division protein ZapA
MAEVELSIGGHLYALTCADGEEASLLRLGRVVDDQVMTARGAIGNLTESRQLLFAALFLADQLETLSNEQPLPSVEATDPLERTAAAADQAAAMPIAAQAERIERLNQRLEANLRIIATALG